MIRSTSSAVCITIHRCIPSVLIFLLTRYTCVLCPSVCHFYCCGPLLLVIQVNTGVSYCLDYVKDIYDDGGSLCPCFNP